MKVTLQRATRRAVGRAPLQPSLATLVDEATLQRGLGCTQRTILVDYVPDRIVRNGLTIVEPSAVGIEQAQFSLQDLTMALWADRYVAATMYEFYYFLARLWDSSTCKPSETLVAYGTHVFPQFNIGKYHIFVASKMCTKKRQTWQEVMCEKSTFRQSDRFLVVGRGRK